MHKYKYKAFITYSHADSKIAAWLQRSLEFYRVPRRLVGRTSINGRIERRIGAIFRDRDELSAGADLTRTIGDALAGSEYQIVICSPASRDSHWVNMEIAEFRKTHPRSAIFCLIVDGEPMAGEDPTLECFPPALGYGSSSEESAPASVEPIAADLRANKDGRRLAKLKILSGLLGLGLDELVQRDAQRRNRNMLVLSLASISGMLVMAVLSVVAIDARNEAQLRRAEAEDLIEFMLTDLRDRLDAVGRLDVLDAVGEKAIEYYSTVELAEHSESSLGRRARAFHLLGEVDDSLGDLESARRAFYEAFQTTVELLARSPNDGDRIFDHAQSVFWVGYLDWRVGNFPEAELAFLEYRDLAERLTALDPDNVDWLIELANAHLNLGVYAVETKGPGGAIPHFEGAQNAYREALVTEPENSELRWSYGQSFAWLADAHEDNGSIGLARELRSAEIDLYQEILSADPANQQIHLALVEAHLGRADARLFEGQVEPAIVDLNRARQYGEGLLAYEPDNTNNVESSAVVYLKLARARSYREDIDSLMPLIVMAAELVTKLLAEDPSVFVWRVMDFRLRTQRADLLSRNGNMESAIQQLLLVESDIKALREADGDVPELKYALAQCYFTMSGSYERTGEHARVLELAHLIAELFSSQMENLPPEQMAILAIAYQQTSNREAYAEFREKLVSMNFKHPSYSALLH